MTSEQQQAILTVALLAAFADGTNHEREREEIRRLAEDLGSQPGVPDLAALYRQVLLKQVDLTDAAKVLTDPDQRRLAYEMAVCVCDADGRTTDAERQFLVKLSTALELSDDLTVPLDRQGDQLVELTEAAAPAVTISHTHQAAKPDISEPELDRSILNYAILNGALELLPQSWASMGIIPLQIKMVYGIGKTYGYELDQGHIRELLATLGVGLTSQYLEQFGRKLLGGLLGKAAGGLAKQLGKAATSMAFSFATTYALGHLAKRYYGSGRQMDSRLLKETFQNLLEPAKQMQTQYLPQIRQKAENLDMGQIMSLVKGG
jgi:uncharacterized protein (DUF697 family)/tellurite resistance protein